MFNDIENLLKEFEEGTELVILLDHTLFVNAIQHKHSEELIAEKDQKKPGYPMNRSVVAHYKGCKDGFLIINPLYYDKHERHKEVGDIKVPTYAIKALKKIDTEEFLS